MLWSLSIKYRVLGKIRPKVSEKPGGHEYRRFLPSAFFKQSKVDAKRLMTE